MNGGNFGQASTPVQASTLVQAIRGPIMLIVLGALVEIDYAGVYGFWRTWPILVIVFGLLKLLEHSGAKPRAPYPGAPADTGRPPGGNAI